MKMTQEKREALFEEYSKRELGWMRAEQEACRQGNHQEAAACHRYRWDCLRVMQRLCENEK
jgi:hypothetical protein